MTPLRYSFKLWHLPMPQFGMGKCHQWHQLKLHLHVRFQDGNSQCMSLMRFMIKLAWLPGLHIKVRIGFSMSKEASWARGRQQVRCPRFGLLWPRGSGYRVETQLRTFPSSSSIPVPIFCWDWLNGLDFYRGRTDMQTLPFMYKNYIDKLFKRNAKL